MERGRLHSSGSTGLLRKPWKLIFFFNEKMTIKAFKTGSADGTSRWHFVEKKKVWGHALAPG